jgi:formamidopyrimidine-DNA glycosylase
MPELPEVETVRRGLEPAMVGRRISSVILNRPNLRFAFPKDFSRRLEGTTIVALRRRAKYLVAELGTEEALIMHLGMSGRFTIRQQPEMVSFYHVTGSNMLHDHVLFHLDDGVVVVYNDPRRFGFMDLVPFRQLDQSPFFAGLGLEPLEGELNGKALLSLFSAKKTSLKSALLDQRLIAGLGNIYSCEALYRARLHPSQQAGSLTALQADNLARAIVNVLREAVKAGGSTLRDFAHADGATGYFQHRFDVYDREGEPCKTPSCSGAIQRVTGGGRSTFFCKDCQSQPIL